MKVLFATSNNRKVHEANQTLAPYNITVEPVSVHIDEIQARDPAEVTLAKAKSAYIASGKPVVVSDTCWEIPSLGGFPGAYMKDISAWFTTEDWLALMHRHEDKTIFCHEHIAYFDGTELQHFVQSYRGEFIDKPRGEVAPEESFESVVVLYGGETMAEQLEKGEVASAGDELGHWKQFGAWYSEKATA